MIWLQAACRRCGADFKVRPGARTRPQCPECDSYDIATWDDQMSLLGNGPPSVQVRPTERNALARIVAGADPAPDDRAALRALLSRMDQARRAPR